MRKFAGSFCVLAAFAVGTVRAEISVGECAVFREGGEGVFLKAPTYWLQGQVVAVWSELRRLERCPVVEKPRASFSREELVRQAQAMPCTQRESDLREIEWGQAELRVDAWETPWSSQHGAVGLLFRGAFMGRPLVKRESLMIGVDWLSPCEQR